MSSGTLSTPTISETLERPEPEPPRAAAAPIAATPITAVRAKTPPKDAAVVGNAAKMMPVVARDSAPPSDLAAELSSCDSDADCTQVHYELSCTDTGVHFDQGSLVVTADAPLSALQNAAAQKAPGADGACSQPARVSSPARVRAIDNSSNREPDKPPLYVWRA